MNFGQVDEEARNEGFQGHRQCRDYRIGEHFGYEHYWNHLPEGQDDGHVHEGDEVGISEYAEYSPEGIVVEGGSVEEERNESHIDDIENVDK